MKIDIESSFLTLGYSVYQFYQRPAVGFYIPLYQREYSWDKDNIEQLLEDIEKGILGMIEYPDTEIRFLGTIITVNEADKKRVQPQDPKSLPTGIEKVIDGQQRLTTICLLGTLLYKNLIDLETKFANIKPATQNQSEIDEIFTIWKKRLLDIFSFDLQSGSPTRKPKIIRGHVDQWIREGKNADFYKSEPSLFFADFISSLDISQHNKVEPIGISKKSGFSNNFKKIDKWINDDIFHAHTDPEDRLAKAWDLMNISSLQDDLWNFERDNLVDIINQKDTKNKKSESYLLCSLVQLLSVCHYVLYRCCFTVIQPKDENWAFDMFQSLNASGTPLTAIETFRPIVVFETEQKENKSFENTDNRKNFDNIENLFRDTNNASTKGKLTNEFLTSVAIVINAHSLEGHFSSQRKYLEKIYQDSDLLYQEQCDLIRFMANYAEFYKTIWLEYKSENNLAIQKINTHQEADLASMLILFLRKSNHRMSITIFATYYNDILENKPNAIENFINAVKAVSAFYILWRSADSNSGLDNAYRNFFKGDKNDSQSFPPQTWFENKGKTLDIQELKKYLLSCLDKKGLSDKKDWLQKSASYLKYESSANICFINLLISSHDTIPDTANVGMIKAGTPFSNPYLRLEKWHSKDLKDIEHIAPKAGANTGWDSNLYDLNSKLFDTLGNLTLLPESSNRSAGNASWKHKLLYYKHLAEKDPAKLADLRLQIQQAGITLPQSTIDILTNSNFNSHILPILSVENHVWDSDIVKKRTNCILDIVWDKIITWLK